MLLATNKILPTSPPSTPIKDRMTRSLSSLCVENRGITTLADVSTP